MSFRKKRVQLSYVLVWCMFIMDMLCYAKEYHTSVAFEHSFGRWHKSALKIRYTNNICDVILFFWCKRRCKNIGNQTSLSNDATTLRIFQNDNKWENVSHIYWSIMFNVPKYRRIVSHLLANISLCSEEFHLICYQSSIKKSFRYACNLWNPFPRIWHAKTTCCPS